MAELLFYGLVSNTHRSADPPSLVSILSIDAAASGIGLCQPIVRLLQNQRFWCSQEFGGEAGPPRLLRFSILLRKPHRAGTRSPTSFANSFAESASRPFRLRARRDDCEHWDRQGNLQTLIDEKGFTNVSLVEGNIFETLPPFLELKPALKIALLHLDLDVYEPTAFVLEGLIPRMVRGGLVVFDDYGIVEGATRAADAICARLGVSMAKLSKYEMPAYFTIP